MRIGIDLHTIGNIMQGSRTYICNLTQALLAQDRENEYVLYLPRGQEYRDLFRGPNVIHRDFPPGGRIARLLVTLPLRLAADRLDIFHCQYIGPLLAPCRVVSTIHDIIHEAHPEFFPKKLGALMRLTYPIGARRASHIITGSAYSRDEIVRRYRVASARIDVIPDAVSSEYRPSEDRAAAAAAAARYGIRAPYILYLGRIEPRKNLPALIEAFRQLKAGGIPHTLAIAGSMDPLFGAYRDSLVTRYGTGEDVCFPGSIAQEDAAAVYAAAEVFAYPSFAEGFGLPVLEAMACGTPVLASNRTSIPEVTGEAAILVNPDEPAAIAQGLSELLGDPALRNRLREAGLRRARQFTWAKTAARTLECYRALGRAN